MIKNLLTVFAVIISICGASFSQTLPTMVGKNSSNEKSAQKSKPPELVGLKGEAAPPFSVTSMDGTQYNSATLHGKIIVINLWGTFCAPCIKEMPELNSLVEKFKNTDVVFLAPSSETKEEIEPFLKKYNFNYQILLNAKDLIDKYTPRIKDAKISKQDAASGILPTHLVIDRAGIVSYYSWGYSPLTATSIKDEIRKQLDKNAETKSSDSSASTAQTADEKAASEILEKHISALGGREAFDKINTVVTVGEIRLLGKTIVTQRVSDVKNKRVFSKTENGATSTKIVFDGQKGWIDSPMFRQSLQADDDKIKSLVKNILGLSGTELYNYRETGRRFVALSDEKIGEKTYKVIKEIQNNAAAKYYFDTDTFLLYQKTVGDAVKQTTMYEDYRQINLGIKAAFLFKNITPQYTSIGKIVKVNVNAKIDELLFKVNESLSTSEPQKSEERIETTDAIKTGELSEEIRLQTFETVRKTIDESFYDRTFNGTDWKEIYNRYLPQAKKISQTTDFHKLLDRMVKELKLSHFQVISPENILTSAAQLKDLIFGSTGLAFRVVENNVVVTDIKKDSAAADSIIKKGFILKSINGKSVRQIYAEYLAENPNFKYRREIAEVRAIGNLLSGKPDTKIEFEMLDNNDRPVKIELLRRSVIRNSNVNFEFKILGNNIGYIKFDAFFGDVISKFAEAIEKLRDTESLIIDLRGNPGGAGDMATALAGMLCEHSGSLGSLQYRYQSEPYDYKGSGDKAYRGKVFILTDARTGSTVEVFSGGLQENKRAFIIGEITAGAVMPSIITLLPTKAALQHVVADFHTPNKVKLEGRGVIPDIAVITKRKDIIGEKDRCLEKVLEVASAK